MPTVMNNIHLYTQKSVFANMRGFLSPSRDKKLDELPILDFSVELVTCWLPAGN